MVRPRLALPRRPSRVLGAAISMALVLVWAYVRLVLFETTMFPLTYAIPLLFCVWTCDRIALWLMTASFVAMHAAKVFWVMPPSAVPAGDPWVNFIATALNIVASAAAVHAIIALRERLETAVHEVTSQGEELEQQNEELQSQSEEIGALNTALERRELLLETLLDTARLSGSEQAAVQHIAAAALDLFGDLAGGAAVYENNGDTLRCHTSTSELAADAQDGFAAVVLQQNRAAALNDVSLRPDLAFPAAAGQPPVRSALCAPIAFDNQVAGVFSIYGTRVHDWSDEEFRLAMWLADQSARALHAIRVQAGLRDADHRKGEFLATLSHELRNPLAPIRYAVELIEQGPAQQGTAVRIMRRQLQQLVRLVDDLLDATRVSRNKVQVRKSRADFGAVVQHAIDASRADIELAGHVLDVDMPRQPVWLEADPERLAQVVANLLNNATRYTPRGGRVGVSVEALPGEVRLRVTDTGVGIEPRNLSRIFEMFTQVGGPGSGGLGIGLAIVRGIIDLHGGTVEAHSEGVGHGSQFVVTLPRSATAAEAGGTATTRIVAPVARRVLVVDDNTDAAAMLGAFLELHGHTVLIAHDARAALTAAGEAVPDVALLDIGLPGMDGYELARRLREGDATRHVRLVALTGWGQDGDRARAREAGFDAHLTKPAEPHMILGVL